MRDRADHEARFRRIRVFLLMSSLLIAFGGCHWGQPPKPAYVPPPASMEPKAPLQNEGPAVSEASQPKAPPPETPAVSLPGSTPGPAETPAVSSPGPSGIPTAQEPAEPVGPPPEIPSPVSGEKTAKPSPPEAVPHNGKKPLASLSYGEPAWAQGKEELVYRVEFLGMTMGYARFTFMGKALVGGRETYHLSVRAWTSDFLSVIYPINETIEYYMDVKTLEPLRQEFSGNEKKKADIAFYDQKKGRISYRYKDSGEIRKEVDLVPSVFDPVTVAYYFRARDLGQEERPRNVYGGRKLYQISSRFVGREKLETVRGPMSTVVIQPIIKREGQLDNKGDLRMWMTDDARHIPVRIYAKFKKIRMWTLYAELVPPREGG